MAAQHKPSKWDGVIPTSYVSLCAYHFGRSFPKQVRIEINSRMRDDLTQEMKVLAWEAQNRKLDVPQAARLFKNGLRSFICHAGGWKNGSRKNGSGKKMTYWKQMEFSNTLSDSTEWDEEGEHFNVQLYRRLGVRDDF